MLLGLLVAGSLTLFSGQENQHALPSEPSSTVDSSVNENHEQSSTTLYYTFNVDGTLHEAVSMDQSSSPFFWLNSGGKLVIENGIGKTVEGELSPFDRWRIVYNFSNPVDTKNGYSPQNVFRLVTKSTWDELEESIRFRIVNTNLIESPNRGGWSGVFLMSSYLDGDNLYYAGLRMDGAAVIKKKYDGRYYTLAIEPLFSADTRSDRRMRPNLIPNDQWLGVKSITRTNDDSSVTIELWVDQHDTENWEIVLTATDTPERHGEVLSGPARAGIRTDFLDVHFDDYVLKELDQS